MDEHVPTAVAKGLRRRGVDVVTTQDAGMLGADDDTQLIFATSQSRVIFTQDDDFLRLAAAGIAYAPQGTPIGAMVRGLMEISTLLNAEDIVNRVEFV
jgi:hypothetical protein